MELQKIIEIAEFYRSIQTHTGNDLTEFLKYEVGDILEVPYMDSRRIVVATCPHEKKIWVAEYYKNGKIGDSVGFLDLTRGDKKVVANILDIKHVLEKIERMEREVEELKKELF